MCSPSIGLGELCRNRGTERVFSLLKEVFGHDQQTVLANYIQAALMLRYNNACLRLKC